MAASVHGCIIDSAALVEMNNPQTSKTFGEYCELKLAKRLRELLKRWRQWTSCLTFTEKYQGNEKHAKEGERTKG